MKLHLPLGLLSVLALCGGTAVAASYTDLTHSWCDAENNVVYDGRGYFAVQSAANTSVELTVSLSSLLSYVNSNDYRTGNPMLLWDTQYDYGLADNADTGADNGSRTPYLSGYWNNAAWSTDNRVDYSTLSRYAQGDSLTLSITNSSSAGVSVSARDAQGNAVSLYTASGLKSSSNTSVSGYRVNLNYVTAVNLLTASTLDTSTYVPPPDYSLPFESARPEEPGLGRVVFLGDSITHGVSDQSYRWQLFKTLTDNGIENEIAGPLEGYYNNPSHTEDAGSSYGGVAFANAHLAQASGRTHNIISGSTSCTFEGKNYSSGVNYGGHSTASTAAQYNGNTWFCMMGTNDLLSDTPNSGPSTAQYAAQMQKVFGGSVQYDAESDRYDWTPGESWGTMGKLVGDVCEQGDTFYVLSITPWGNHSNHNRDMDHYAGQEFNRNLEAWSTAYAASSGKNVVYVDVCRGMVDLTSGTRNMGHNAFFNSSADRLHPNEQGSILMAGNLAQAMGIGGRTAGLQRRDTAGWAGISPGSLSAGESLFLAENAFTMEEGYTVDVGAAFGNGAEDGWLSAESALSVSLGDGTHSGTLNVSEGYLMWGSEVLYCADTSALQDAGRLRIAWHNGCGAENVQQGYYVWLGDMLIGQGLAATTGQGLNGVLLSSAGASASLSSLSWADAAYAPTTSGLSYQEYAYVAAQDAADVAELVVNSAYTASGVDFSQTSAMDVVAGHIFAQNSTAGETLTYKLASADGWVGMLDCDHTGEINLQVVGKTKHTVFGVVYASSSATLTLEVEGDATVGNGSYSGQTAAIAGSYGNGSAESFRLYMNDGLVQGDIVAGAVYGSGHIGSAKMVISGGMVQGSVLGGSKSSGVVGSAEIIVKGGMIIGDIEAGGRAGTVGNTHVLLSGGVVQGDITKGAATRTEGAVASLTIVGSEARILGSIEADCITLIDVQQDIVATLADASVVELTGKSSTAMVMGQSQRLERLILGSGTSLSAWVSAAVTSSATEYESTLLLSALEVGQGAALNANISFAEGAELSMGGTLTLGSAVSLAGKMCLNLSEEMQQELLSNGRVTLFSGVDALSLGGESLASGSVWNASRVFDNLAPEADYQLSFSQGELSLALVPEPATASLGLLALAALALRRRRAC